MCTVFPTNKTTRAQSTQTASTVPRTIHPNAINRPTCNPPLPISIIFFHAIPHKQNNHLHTIHPNETNRPTPNLAKRHQPPICNPPLPISTKPCGVPIPHRGYTFDSAGLASATQPTLGNDASEEATPLGVVLFLIAHHYHTRRMDYS